MRLLLAATAAFGFACQSEPTQSATPSIYGTVFDDANGDGEQAVAEAGVAGITVFVDEDGDGLLGPSEPVTTTRYDGSYGFENLEPGTHQVRLELPYDYRNEVDANAPAAPGARAIIGGADTDAGLYPFMVSLGQRSGSEFFAYCGGALISDTWVLTAAHCVEDEEASDTAILVGSQYANTGGTAIDIAEIRVHPEWTGSTSYGYDLALLRTAQRMDLASLGVHTVDLVTEDDVERTQAGALATTIGWGTSDNPSDALQEVHVPITSEDVCAEAYPQVRSFDTQICAGARGGGLDSCQGDSGGPFLVRSAEGDRWLHAGITSWGNGCGLAGQPGIYGRTSAMASWVFEQMRETSLAYNVALGSRGARVDFSLSATTRPRIGEIPERWSISRLDFGDIEGEEVEANRSITSRFFLFTEPGSEQSLDELSCTFDRDGAGPEAPTEVDCAPGTNRFTFSGYDDGVFLSTLEVTTANRSSTRTRFVIAGTPSSVVIPGTLQVTDGTDPDYPGDYYIDYFELTELTSGVVSLLEVEAEYGTQLSLYDGDVRDASGGGRLDVDNGPSGLASLRLFPEAGKRYLVGVSTLSERRSGPYELRIIGSGNAAPTEL